MSLIEVGKSADGRRVMLDLVRLIGTRLLVQARSGAGKSFTLRRLLEQTHGKVQHIVLDPEGEFGSLRERFDYVLTGKGGDIASDPATAELLARRLLELGVSAICDLYELKPRDRRRFVRVFLEALVNAPKELWASSTGRPVLVVLDEAHDYCPEKRPTESSEAVIDLCKRGRKRGLCVVLATQRLSSLSKEAAAQCGNILVGATWLDIDRNRAAEALGLVRGAAQRELMSGLMKLHPGQFWAVGDAFELAELTLCKVGPVATHHPSATAKAVKLAPPPVPEKVRAVLAKLADLPKEAEDERTREARLIAQVRELQATVNRLDREMANRPTEKVGISDEELAGYLTQRDLAWEGKLDEALGEGADYRKALERVPEHLRAIVDAFAELPGQSLTIEPPAPWQVQERTREATRARFSRPKPATPRQSMPPRATPAPSDDGDYHPRAGARRMLEALARYHQGVMTTAQLRTMARLRKSGTSGTYLRELRHHELVEGDDTALRITQAGLDMVGMQAAQPLTAEEVLDHWRERFRAGARRMLDALVDDRGRGMTREQIGEIANLEPTSGTFGTYLGELKRNGLAVETGGMIYLAEELR